GVSSVPSSARLLSVAQAGLPLRAAAACATASGATSTRLVSSVVDVIAVSVAVLLLYWKREPLGKVPVPSSAASGRLQLPGAVVLAASDSSVPVQKAARLWPEMSISARWPVPFSWLS